MSFPHQHLREVYNISLAPFYKAFEMAEKEQSLSPEEFETIYNVVQYAIAYQMQAIENSLKAPTYDHPMSTVVPRNLENPTHYISRNTIGASWADEVENPLEKEGEKWNEGRRATYNGMKYQIVNGMPVNPNLQTGITGRIVGRYGPSLVVDTAITVEKLNQYGEVTVHVLAVTKDNVLKGKNVVWMPGGFANTPKNADGKYTIDNSKIYYKQAEELMEEGFSACIELLPEDTIGMEDDLNKEIETRAAKQKSPITDAQREYITREIETKYKMKKLRETEPVFCARVLELCKNAHQCYAGPILDCPRDTDNAWMETTFGLIKMDQETLDWLLEGNKSNLSFKAGDDAKAIDFVEINSDLIENANCHRPFFPTLLAMHGLTSKEISAPIKGQMNKLLDFYKNAPIEEHNKPILYKLAA